jgi:hypothetical protein
VTFDPQFPADWEDASASNYRVGEASFSFHYHRTRDRISVLVNSNKADGYKIEFGPVLGLGTNVKSVEVDGKPVHFQTETFPQGIEPVIVVDVTKPEMNIDIVFDPSVELLPPLVETRTGDSDHGLKIVSLTMNENVMRVDVEGLSGMVYNLNILNPEKIESVSGGKIKGNSIEIAIPSSDKSEFVKHTISIVTK